MPPRKPRIEVEQKVRQDITALVTAHPMGESIAEMSYCLARAMDHGAGLLLGTVNRELRGNLAELSRLAVDADDTLERELSTPAAGVRPTLRDTTES
jgi:hypothetical protein